MIRKLNKKKKLGENIKKISRNIVWGSSVSDVTRCEQMNFSTQQIVQLGKVEISLRMDILKSKKFLEV